MKNIYDMSPKELDDLIAENQAIQSKDPYIRKNRGHVTASKLKLFEKSPEAYFIQYVLEMPLPKQEEDEKDSIKIWNAVDYYISYWEMEFFSKYFLQTKKLLKADLEAMCVEQWLDATGTVPVLEQRLFWDKIKLSEALSKRVLWVIAEWKRQPLFDYDGDYETQKEVTAKYKNLDLKVTLDRLWVEKWLLRDCKTVWPELDKFIFQIADYGYDFSMSYYNVICKLAYKKDFTVILDAGKTTAPYPSCSYVLPPETIVGVAKTRIMPNLEILAETTKKWEETKDPKVWLTQNEKRDTMYSLDAYSKMETTLQTEFEYIQ